MSVAIIDVVIVGAGPAGLQAAVHASRKKASVVVLGKPERSSIYKAHVENYLCVDGVTDGNELLAVAMKQAKRFGAEVIEEDVLHIEQENTSFTVKTEGGKEIAARTLIVATGTSRKKLKVKGEKELTGKGVSYCVDCDANFYRGAKVAVVGNESAAVDGALTLTKYASEVHLVAQKLDVSAKLLKKLSESSVQFHEGVWAQEINGENAVEGLLLDNETVLDVEGVFVELGAKGGCKFHCAFGSKLHENTFHFKNGFIV